MNINIWYIKMERLKRLGLDKVPYTGGYWTPLHQRLLEEGFLVCKDGSYISWGFGNDLDIYIADSMSKLSMSNNKSETSYTKK
jgi:hypothetical protein